MLMNFVPALWLISSFRDARELVKESLQSVHKFITDMLHQHQVSLDASNIRDATDMYLVKQAETAKPSDTYLAGTVCTTDVFFVISYHQNKYKCDLYQNVFFSVFHLVVDVFHPNSNDRYNAFIL